MDKDITSRPKKKDTHDRLEDSSFTDASGENDLLQLESLLLLSLTRTEEKMDLRLSQGGVLASNLRQRGGKTY